MPSEVEGEEESDAPPVKGISLPTRAIEDDDEEEAALPDWLLGLADQETTGPVSEAEPQSGEAGAEDEGGYPEWLSGLVDEEAFNGEEPEASPDADAFSLEDEYLPDWLRDVEEPDQPPQREEPQEASRDVLKEDVPAEPAGSDWDVPDWLADHADPSLAEDYESTGQPLPDWLVEQGDELAVPSAPSAQSLPSWLQPGADEESSAEEEPEEIEAVAPPEEVLANPFEAPEPEPTPEFELDAEGLPAWLSEELEEREPEPEAQRPSERGEAEETALPEWLRDVDEELPEEGEVETEALEVVEEEPQPERQEDLAVDSEPVVKVPPEDGEGVPAWLADIEVIDEVDVEAATEVFAQAPESVEPSEAPEITLPDDAPEWLRNIASSERPSVLQGETPPLIATEEEAEPGEPEAEVAEPEEIPDWLRDLEPAAAEERYVPGSPSGEGREERPAPANLPAWMRGLKPPESAGEAEEVRSYTEAAEAEGLVPAEIPDWVRALRPDFEAGGAQTPRAERVQKAASLEMEGPLASLRGVLAETSIVDFPTDADVSLTVELPEDVRDQAELWQELLSRPRSVKRSVAQRGRQHGQGSTAVRLLLTAILWLGTLLGLWVLTPAMRISQSPSPQQAPGVGILRDQLDQLQPGDTVLIAVEYGPAYADEMNAMAEALLEHLEDREVNLRIASTRAEGIGLSQAAVMEVYGHDNAVLQRTYRANQMPGVARYLQSQEAQGAGQLLILASNPSRVRWWIEQNAALQGVEGVAPLPVSVAVSASVGPMIAPYLEQSLVDGWIIGLPQTLAYRELRGLDNASYAGIPDVLMLMHWVVAGFLLFGLLYHLALGKKGAG